MSRSVTTTYAAAAALPLADVIMRWQELERRDRVAGSDGEDAPPLTVGEYLELLALGAVAARYFQRSATVARAVTAGATQEQVRAALGPQPDQRM